MNLPELNDILKVLERKIYKIFNSGIPYNLNIGGIRTNDMNPNKFNDWIYCFYKDEPGGQKFHCWLATTDPGLYYLRYPLYKKGTAILAPGQYLGCWRLGLHKGMYKALIQTGNARVYRDANRDDKYDYDESSAEWGLFGINIHRASKWGIDNYVNGFSARCQVFKDPGDFGELIGMSEKALKSFHNNLSYTLLEEGVLPIINLNSPSYQLKKMDGDLEASKKNDLFLYIFTQDCLSLPHNNK